MLVCITLKENCRSLLINNIKVLSIKFIIIDMLYPYFIHSRQFIRVAALARSPHNSTMKGGASDDEGSFFHPLDAYLPFIPSCTVPLLRKV